MIKKESIKELSKILHIKLNYESLALIFVVFFFSTIIVSESQLFEYCNLMYFFWILRKIYYHFYFVDKKNLKSTGRSRVRSASKSYHFVQVCLNLIKMFLNIFL